MFKKTIGFGLLGILILALLIQLVPYGKNHVNPPVVQEPAWDSPATRALAQRACFDCHSNETVWPWYSNIREGEMPPAVYLPMHPAARLTAAEREQLVQGLLNSLR